MKPDEQRMRDVLVDTIRLLCRTGVEYSQRLRVQGLLGITVDDEHVFLIHVDDFIARNCTDIDDSSCGYPEDSSTANGALVISDVVDPGDSSEEDNASEEVRENCTERPQLGSVAQHPKQSLLSQATHNDILASVALSELSSVVAVPTEARDLPSSQPLSQNTQNVPLHGNIPATVVAESCKESDELARDGAATATGSSDASVTVPQSSLRHNVLSDYKDEPLSLIKMEVDDGVNCQAESVVPPCGDMNSGMTCMTSGVNHNQHGPPSLDDVESSSSTTNEDGDSEHTSESEEVADHVRIPRLDLISPLQYNPQALVGSVSKWHVGSVQRSGSDAAADTVTIPQAVLSGVVQTGGSHVSAYYQQQVVAFFIFTSPHYLSYSPSMHL